MSKSNKSISAKPSNLTAYIMLDLMNRIRSHTLSSDDLSLQSLAKYYNVSITPLRAAINKLIEDGFIIKLPNRRLQVNLMATKRHVPRVEPSIPPTPRYWDNLLIKEVVLASLCLSKSYLREDFLSKKLKVGRSIIRQALHRFAGAGLIEHIPRRGWLVHPFGIEDMRAYLVVRELLELKALRLARPNLNKAELQQIKQRLAKSVNSDELTLDNSIHDYIIEKSKNRYIRQFFQQYVALYYTELFHFAAPEISVVEEMSSQHRCIIDALIARHWAKAEKFLAEHIEAQAAVLIKLLEKKQTEFASHESA